MAVGTSDAQGAAKARDRRRMWYAPAMHRLNRLNIAILAATTAILALTGCRRTSNDPLQANASNAAAAGERAALPVTEPPLMRADLLQAVAAAASAAALGEDDSATQRALSGDRFELRIRFGCGAPPATTSDQGTFAVSFDPETRRLRVRAEPDISLSDPFVTEVAGPEIEAVEGFWLPTPWLLSAGCPARPAASPAAEPSDAKARKKDAAPPAAEAEIVRSPRIGIASFYSPDDSRTHRRNDRPYEAAVTLGDEEGPSAKGYDLVLVGRLSATPGARVITCRPRGIQAPPDCIIAADMEQVRIEAVGSGARLASWSP